MSRSGRCDRHHKMSDSGAYFLPGGLALACNFASSASSFFTVDCSVSISVRAAASALPLTVDLGLRFAAELEHRLLKKLNVGLQAGGPALHLLFNRADLHAANVLGLRRRLRGRKRHNDAQAWRHPKHCAQSVLPLVFHV